MEGKPIIFSTDMVKAVLAGNKTMTRRVIKAQMVNPKMTNGECVEIGNDDTVHFKIKCPYGNRGDLLWVRETWREPALFEEDQMIYYKAGPSGAIDMKWKPSIHMPKKYARLWLKVVDVRLERLQDITEADAISEGIKKFTYEYGSVGYGTQRLALGAMHKDALTAFWSLWDSINFTRGYGMDKNPWVWVVEFERIESPTYLEKK